MSKKTIAVFATIGVAIPTVAIIVTKNTKVKEKLDKAVSDLFDSIQQEEDEESDYIW